MVKISNTVGVCQTHMKVLRKNKRRRQGHENLLGIWKQLQNTKNFVLIDRKVARALTWLPQIKS